jgi:hypothetical protein
MLRGAKTINYNYKRIISVPFLCIISMISLTDFDLINICMMVEFLSTKLPTST